MGEGGDGTDFHVTEGGWENNRLFAKQPEQQRASTVRGDIDSDCITFLS